MVNKKKNSKLWLTIGIIALVLFWQKDFLGSFLGIKDGYYLLADSSIELTDLVDTHETNGQFDSKYWYAEGIPGEYYDTYWKNWYQNIYLTGSDAKAKCIVSHIHGDYGATGYLYHKSDLKNKDFKVYINGYVGCGESGSGLDAYMKIKLVDSYTNPQHSILIREYLHYQAPLSTFLPNEYGTQDGGLELKWSVLYPDKAYVSWRSEPFTEYDFSDWSEIHMLVELFTSQRSGGGAPPLFACASKVEIVDARVRPIFGCIIDEGEGFVSARYTAGEDIYITDDFKLSGSSHVISKFCVDHPAQIIGPTASTETNEIYEIIVEGGTYTVQSGEQVRLFYISDTGVICGDNEYYDDMTGECRCIIYCDPAYYQVDEDTCTCIPLSTARQSIVTAPSFVLDKDESGQYQEIVDIENLDKNKPFHVRYYAKGTPVEDPENTIYKVYTFANDEGFDLATQTQLSAITLDSMDSTSGWTIGRDFSSISTTTDKKEGVFALELVLNPSHHSGNYGHLIKDISVDISQHNYLSYWFYISDLSFVNCNSDQPYVLLYSDVSNNEYIRWRYDCDELNIGWNKIIEDLNNPLSTTTGFDPTNVNRIRVIIYTPEMAGTATVRMDHFMIYK